MLGRSVDSQQLADIDLDPLIAKESLQQLFFVYWFEVRDLDLLWLQQRNVLRLNSHRLYVLEVRQCLSLSDLVLQSADVLLE